MFTRRELKLICPHANANAISEETAAQLANNDTTPKIAIIARLQLSIIRKNEPVTLSPQDENL